MNSSEHDADWFAARFEEHCPQLRKVAYRMLGLGRRQRGHGAEGVASRQPRRQLVGREPRGLVDDDRRSHLSRHAARARARVTPRGLCRVVAAGADRHGGFGVTGGRSADGRLRRAGAARGPRDDDAGRAACLRPARHVRRLVRGDRPDLGRSPAAARQLANRARRRVRGTTVDADVGIDEQREIISAFLAASRAGDFDALVAVLDRVVSGLIRATGDDGEPALSDDEILGVVNSFFVAGVETTQNFLPLLMRELLQHREQWDALVADPSKIENAVEEGLRYWSPARSNRRYALVDVTVGDVTIPAGSVVLLLPISANHDEAVFAEPETFDIDRANAPKHLGFGHGVHLCIGAAVARLEAVVAVRALAQRIPGLRLVDDGHERWVPHVTLPRLASVELAWAA